MPSNAEVTQRLATRLKNERTSKGLSLEALAKLSGVSRSMLSQIERGEASPTVASLWNLTNALKVDFAELLDAEKSEEKPIIEVLRQSQIPVIHRQENGFLIRILSAPEDVGETEVYDITFEKDGLLDSSPHRDGCVEHLTVYSGSVTVTSDGQSAELNAGDTARYKADLEHSIRAKKKSRIVLIVKSN